VNTTISKLIVCLRCLSNLARLSTSEYIMTTSTIGKTIGAALGKAAAQRGDTGRC
jgi:hypothetical protein